MAAGQNPPPYSLRQRHTSSDAIVHQPGVGAQNQQQQHLSPIPEEKKEVTPQKKELRDREIPVINMKDFEEVDVGDKLNLLMAAINKINTNFTNFYHRFDALKKQLTDNSTSLSSRVDVVEKFEEEYGARIDELESLIPSVTDARTRLTKNELATGKLQDDGTMIKGLLQVHEKKISICADKVVDLTARSMANNILISGIAGDQLGENCKEKVLTLLRDKMNMTVEDTEVEVAHRLGAKTGTKPRTVVVRCVFALRDRVFQFTKNLKDITNEQGDSYFVNPQLPEPLAVERRDREEQYRSIKKSNARISDEEAHRRVPVHIKNKVLYINKVPQKHHIFPPTVQEMLNVKPAVQDKMNAITFSESSTVVEKGSTFSAFATHVKNTTDVKLAYARIRQICPESDHVMLGYTLKNYTGHHDNGEYGASKKILQKILDNGSANTAVFVTREYGGVHLGQRRFMYIERVAQEALLALQSS